MPKYLRICSRKECGRFYICHTQAPKKIILNLSNSLHFFPSPSFFYPWFVVSSFFLCAPSPIFHSCSSTHLHKFYCKPSLLFPSLLFPASAFSPIERVFLPSFSVPSPCGRTAKETTQRRKENYSVKIKNHTYVPFEHDWLKQADGSGHL